MTTPSEEQMAQLDPLAGQYTLTARYTSPIAAARFSFAPEFVDSKGLKLGYGIPRSTGYALAAAGLVRTVCLRKPGAVRGKRLWEVASLRAYLIANLDQRKQEPTCLPSILTEPQP
jgi:hypothetical protein